MAHHNNTPKTVLDAPHLTPVLVYENRGLNREHRRHDRTATGGRKFVPKSAQYPTMNVPFEKVGRGNG